MKVVFVKSSISIFTVTILLLVFIFPGQANAAHCNEGVVYRDCNAECPAGTYDCLASCNQSNDALYEQARECELQVHDQEQGEEETEEPQQQEQPSSPIPESEDAPSLKSTPITTVSPSPLPKVRRLDLGRDFKEGQVVTAGENEILIVGLGTGGRGDVNSGASFSYKESDSEINFEHLAGSIRYFFEGFIKPRYIQTSNAVTSTRGTDFVVNDEKDRTEVLVFDGNLAVSDVNGQNTVDVGSGYKTVVKSGGKPSKPELFDSSKIDRWFDAITPENSQRQLGVKEWVVVAVALVVGLVVIYFGIKMNIKRLKRARKRK